MIRLIAAAVLLFSPVAAQAGELDSLVAQTGGSQQELEDFILVPFQGTWVQGGNTLVFAAGDTRDGNWIIGNLVGGTGQVNRYLWSPTTATGGTFYFDTPQGRQGPVIATFSNGNRKMTWQFGAERSEFTKVN